MIKTSDINKVSRAVVGAAFKLHPSNVNRWAENGCPKNPDNKTYNLPNVIQWRLEELLMDTPTPNTAEGEKWLTKFRKERAKKAKIERETLEGKLLRKEWVAEQWGLRVANVAAGLEAFVNRLPPVLELKSRAEIREILKVEIKHLRNSYAREGRYCPREFDFEEFQTDLAQLFDKYLTQGAP